MGVFAENLEMWLSVQYWEMFYDDDSFECGDNDGKKRVTFKDEVEMRNKPNSLLLTRMIQRRKKMLPSGKNVNNINLDRGKKD